MEEEDDDFYAPEDSVAKATPNHPTSTNEYVKQDVKTEDMEDAEEEDEDSDSVSLICSERTVGHILWLTLGRKSISS